MAVVGPTAAGKTATAVELAERLGGEIVSADAFQVYRGLDIGTAKPSVELRERAPHHLIDISEPDEQYNVAQFLADAKAAVEKIHAAGRPAILVGGSGQYIKAFTEQWQIPAVPPDEKLRERLAEMKREGGVAALAAELAKINPAAAEKVDSRNPARLVRAIERTLHGDSASEYQKGAKVPYKTIIVGCQIGRAALHERVEARILKMFDGGWIDEVQNLLGNGITFDAPAMKAIGYRDIIKHIKGEQSREMLIPKIKSDTHRLIRHQANWFKPDEPGVSWFPYDAPEAAYEFVAEQLAGHSYNGKTS